VSSASQQIMQRYLRDHSRLVMPPWLANVRGTSNSETRTSVQWRGGSVATECRVQARAWELVDLSGARDNQSIAEVDQTHLSKGAGGCQDSDVPAAMSPGG
jgi:hypothetical protein